MFKNNGIPHLLMVFMAAATLILSGCGGDSGDGGNPSDDAENSYIISGSVNGLHGSGLIIKVNNSQEIAITENGPFEFANPLPVGTHYSVSVATQPSAPAQLCTVSQSMGLVPDHDVTDVEINCSTVYGIGGTVSGLEGSGLEIRVSLSTTLAIDANGDFLSPAVLAWSAPYNVTVVTQPDNPRQYCSVTNGSGTMPHNDVTDVEIVCKNTYTINGSVTGLEGSGLVIRLDNNSQTDTALDSNGEFQTYYQHFESSPYSVSIAAQPTGPNQVCHVENDSGTITDHDITDVQVVCTNATYTVGGTVSGMIHGGIGINLNQVNIYDIASNGDFTYPVDLEDGSDWELYISKQPYQPNQTCSVTPDHGTINGVDVTNVVIACVTNTLSIGGTVSGLLGSGLMLQVDGGHDIAISENGAFESSDQFDHWGTYELSIANQPSLPNQTCELNISTIYQLRENNHLSIIAVTCTNDGLLVGVNVSGLHAAGLVLQNNGGDDLTIDADGTYYFATSLMSGSEYKVTVKSTPNAPRHSCHVTHGSGTIASADVTDVNVTCTNMAGYFIDPISKPDYGRAIATGDLDGDGDIDMVLGNNTTPNTVWLNDGKGGYVDSGQTLGSAQTYDVALGDIDGDGDLDLISANVDQPSSLWLNDGAGTFTFEQTLSTTPWLSVDLGDVDGDKDLDLVATVGGANQVWINNTGTLVDSGQTLGTSRSYDVVLADIDADGDQDMLVANGRTYSYDGPEAEKIWLNNGAGQFSEGPSLGAGVYTYAIAVGDVNGDGKLDIVTGEWGDNIVWINNGNNSFSEGQHMPPAGNDNTYDVVLGDLDHDGDLDLIEALSSNGGIGNRVWFNDAGVFSDSGQSVSGNHVYGNQSYALALADIDGDGDSDLLTAFYGGLSYPGVHVALNNGTGLLTDVGQTLPSTGQSKYTGFADLDGDGDMDHIAGRYVYDNDGATNYTLTTNDIHCYNLLSAVILDVDADNDLDIISGCYNVGVIFTNDGNGSFAASGETLTQGGSAFESDVMVTGDLDGDGALDVIIGNAVGYSLSQVNTVWLNNEDGTFTRMADIPAAYTSGLALADVNGDNKLDLVESVSYDGYASHVYYGNGDGTFNTANVQPLSSTHATSVAVGDVNGDDKVDIVLGIDDAVGTYDGAADEIWLNNGEGVFSLSVASLPVSNTWALDLGDVDGDGDLDLVTGNNIYNTGEPTHVLLNDGAGNFTLHQSLGMNEIKAIKLVDVDSDGDLDIGIANRDGFDSVYINQTR